MTNYDIEYVSDTLDIAIESIQTAIDQVEGIAMVIDDAKINMPTIDKAILKSIRNEINDAQDLLMCYVTELQARKS